MKVKNKKATTTNTWKEIRKNIFEKYNYKCAICNSISKDLLIHHIDGEKLKNYNPFWRANNNTENLILLCRSCHSHLHSLKKEDVRLGERLMKIRNQILEKLWIEYKAELTMEEFAKVFRLSLPQVWRILKEEDLKVDLK